MNILEIEQVTRSFRSSSLFSRQWQVQALRQVSLSLKQGQTLGIVGESGCGKSTLARLLLGLDRPDGGSIRLDGQDIGALDRRRFSAMVQPVFQDPYSSLNPRRSIIDTVAQPLIVHKRGTAAERKQRAREMLEMVGLPERLHGNYPAHLSGGQRQRVAVARALILKPRVLVCDEPTSALDVSIQAQILNLIRELQRELSLSIVFISHNLSVVNLMSDEVAVMYLGRVVEWGSAEDIFRRPGHPYTKALLASALPPRPELDLPELHLGLGFPDPGNPPSGCGFNPRCALADELCRKTAPAMRPLGPGHAAECHYAGKTPEMATPA